MTHQHEYSYDNDLRDVDLSQKSMACKCGAYLFQHAPGHPYGSQAGPNGQSSRWCLLPECDWRTSTHGRACRCDDCQSEARTEHDFAGLA